MAKRSIIIYSLILLLGFSITSYALSAVPFKIAVVDTKSLTKSSSQVALLKKERSLRMEKLDKWYQASKIDVSRQKSQAEKDRLTKKYAEDYKRKKAELKKEFDAKFRLADRQIYTTVINKANAGNYDIILSKKYVLYGGDDITAIVEKAIK